MHAHPLRHFLEVLNSNMDPIWQEAEQLARKVGSCRRMLKCGSRIPDEAVLAELGWMTMRGRRMLLRLSYWGKILGMDGGRWVRKVYEQGRARLTDNARSNTWCNLTRKWLLELGLHREWQDQAVGPGWQEKLRAKIEDRETREWRRKAPEEAVDQVACGGGGIAGVDTG